jgi:ArsR family transcriptional regulator
MKPSFPRTQEIEVLKALAQPVRLQILEILRHRPTCVCDLAELTGQRQPYISQQLIVLKEAGLVDFQSDGPKNYYRLNRRRINDTLQALSLLSREPQPNLNQ